MKPAPKPRAVVDLRAPPQEVWDRLSTEERRRVLDSLPSDVERETPPEGDLHRLAKSRAFEALDEFYRRTRRRIYLSSELPVYDPDEPMFAPDLIAVLDVEPHDLEPGKALDGSAPLWDARELIGHLATMVDDAVRRAEEESRRAEEESRRAEKLAARLRELLDRMELANWRLNPHRRRSAA